MGELRERLAVARRHVRVDWSADRSAAAEAGLSRRRTRRARTRAVAIMSSVAMLLVIVGLFIRPRIDPVPLVARASHRLDAPGTRQPARIDDRMALADGSVVRPFVDSVVRPRKVTSTAVDVDLIHGGAAFDVAPNPARLFRVQAGAITVEVIGTAFSVEEIETKVVVAVERGRVRVRWADRQRELGVGERVTFPPDEGDGGETEAPDAGADVATPERPTWHALAKAGDYDKAYEVLHTAGEHTVRDVPDELLLAADVARLSGHPAQAVDPLRRVARDHRGDPRAALAAFTLGRVLLDSLGRPREAADAFADVRALGGGGLGEEALAREVEARSRAGDSERARTLAQQYVTTYPDGKRTRSVKKFGGLE